MVNEFMQAEAVESGNPPQIGSDLAAQIINAVVSKAHVAGLTHEFYRYPARFSPLFARAMIQAFTKPGDTVLDPFMGGGTTMVEACSLGRQAIGTDINELSVFISKVKTTPLTDAEVESIQVWAQALIPNLSLRKTTAEVGNKYQKNIHGKSTWPIRKVLELALSQVPLLETEKKRQFARCVLLKTAQGALDCRENIPTVSMFRAQFLKDLAKMLEGMKEFRERIQAPNSTCSEVKYSPALCLHRSAIGIEGDENLRKLAPPSLIVTSPPYPGVHVLYHRWQVQGRRETPAPYWIINGSDGKGESFYTLGGRSRQGIEKFFKQTQAAFTSLARISSRKTLLVQMVAFSDPEWQLPEYLSAITKSGFREVHFSALSNSPDGRLWRGVPNRKWYAVQAPATATNKEVVLFHQLA